MITLVLKKSTLKDDVMSNLQIAAFYDRNLLIYENPPNEKILLYWLAFDNLVALSNDEKTKLAQLLNTDDSCLNNEQKELKYKILYANDFKNNIITYFKQSFGQCFRDDMLTLQNINKNLPNHNYTIYILHALEKNLIDQERQFKTIFLSNPIQEIYNQFYKIHYNVQEVPNDKLLTKELIKSLNNLPDNYSSLHEYGYIEYPQYKHIKKFINYMKKIIIILNTD